MDPKRARVDGDDQESANSASVWKQNGPTPASNVVSCMIEDSRKEFQKGLSDVKREVIGLKQELQQEMEYARSRNLLIFGWKKSDDEKKVSVLESNVVAFINQNVLSGEPKMTSDWVGKIHYMPDGKKGSTKEGFGSVMVQCSQLKFFHIIWGARMNLKSFNEQRKKDDLPSLVLERHHTMQYGKQLRYLNKVRNDLIKNRNYQPARAKINGNKKDQPLLTVDGVIYNATNIPQNIFGSIGMFGQPTEDRGRPQSSAQLDP